MHPDGPYSVGMADNDRPGFWKRQFTGEPTARQTVYDVVFGILMPVICLVADPIVFAGTNRLLNHYRWLAYSTIGGEMLILALWLLLRRRLGSASLFFAGPLLAGGVLALAIHAYMLPWTLIGMLFLVGILGFTPMMTGIAYLRNGFRAAARCGYRVGWAARIGILLAGGILMVLPALGVLHFRHHETLPDLVKAAVTGRVKWLDGDSSYRD